VENPEERRPELTAFYFRERADSGSLPVIYDRTWYDDILRRPLASSTDINERCKTMTSLSQDGRGSMKNQGIFTSLGMQRKELRGTTASLRSLRRKTAFLMTPSGISGDIIALLIEYVRQFFLQEVATLDFSWRRRG
jgi:hypothetical protein